MKIIKKDVMKMTRKEFNELPERKWDEDIGEFDSLIILPLRPIHDSGYRCLDFVACKYLNPICRLSGVSDVLHINGISGLGENWTEKYKSYPDKVSSVDWSIDCLPKSGLLRLFSSKKLKASTALSSFEIFAKEA